MITGTREQKAIVWRANCDHCSESAVLEGRVELDMLGRGDYYCTYRPKGWVVVRADSRYVAFCSWSCAAAACAAEALQSSQEVPE